MAGNTYDFNAVTVICDGNIIAGWADGDDVITTETAEDEFEYVEGADGEVMAHTTQTRMCEVHIKLLYTSSSNAILDSLLKARANFQLSIADNRGGYTFTSATARLVKRPPVELGKSANDMDWKIMCMDFVDSRAGIDDIALAG